MAENTPNLNLYKVNPSTDGDMTFNIKTMLNENWDKIDDYVQKEIYLGTESPTTPIANDLWIDTSVTPHILKSYDGTSWKEIGKTPPVTSVNSKTGDITLTAADVGAEPTFTKKTAFNKDFGTTPGTVADGGEVAANLNKIDTELNKVSDKVDFNQTEIFNRHIENVGAGVNSGLGVLESSTPDMNVTVESGVIYMPNGERFELGSTTITIDTADVTYDRKDIIYISSLGNFEYLAGIPSSTPVKPDLPSGAIEIQEINVPAGTTAIEQSQLLDTRVIKESLEDLKNELERKLDAHKANDVNHVKYAVDTGTANAKVVTLSPTPTSYVDGMAISFKNAIENTGATTINVNNLGAIPIKKANGNDVSSGNLKAGIPYTLRYNGTAFILQGEGGEYGTVTSNDVRNTKTFGTENGVEQGTLDLSLLVADNIRDGVTIDGVLGSLVERRFATGTGTSDGLRKFTVSGLAFKPRVIIIELTDYTYHTITTYCTDIVYGSGVKYVRYASLTTANISGFADAVVSGNDVTLDVGTTNQNLTWWAYE